MIGRPILLPPAAPPGQRVRAVVLDIDARDEHRVDARSWWVAWILANIALVPILLLALALGLVGLDRQGYGNTYYAAAVKSMLSSWESFFFASFDPGNFVSVDKPPLGLWAQVLSVRLFGFTGPSLLLPQVIAGIASVVVVYHLVRRVAGQAAGLIAALALTVTPISAVTNRNNTMDSQLVLVLVLALWAATRAAERGQLRWLLGSAALVGLAYNIKMLQAFPVVPAFAVAYQAWAPLSLKRRIAHLGLAGVVLILVSVSWSVAVDMTPTDERPYIGSSGSNSALSLALGYNGLGRLYQSPSSTAPQPQISSITIDLTQSPSFAPQIGDPGPWRLFRAGVADEASWLLPLALLGLALGVVSMRRGALETTTSGALRSRRVALTLWGGWVLAWVGYFTLARFYHLYYLIMLGPAVAALSGMTVAQLWARYSAGGWGAALLPLCFIGTAAFQVWMLGPYGSWNGWLTPVIVGLTLVAVLGLFIFHRSSIVRAVLATGLGVLAITIAPTIWSVTSIQDGRGGAWLPEAGPPLAFPGGPGRASPPDNRRPGNPQPGLGQAGGPAFQGGGPPPGPGGVGAMTFAGAQWNILAPGLADYLLAHQQGSRYLVATTTSSYASVFMLATDQPAMALGGYQGWDHVLSPKQLAERVALGEVRYFYIPAQGGFGRGADSPDATAELTAWVRQTCSSVAASEWSDSSGTGPGAPSDPRDPRQRAGFGRDQLQLYRCGT